MLESRDITLDGSGNGTIVFSAIPTYRQREYKRIALSINTGENSQGGAATVYAGEVIPAFRVDGTATPWLDTMFTNPGQVVLRNPLQLRVVFENCDPNARATVVTEYIES